jgi:hypothetical protein
MAWWQERHLTKGQLELRTPLLMTMPSGEPSTRLFFAREKWIILTLGEYSLLDVW